MGEQGRTVSELMSAAKLIVEVVDGCEHGWPTELDWLWSVHRDQTLALMDKVRADGGIRFPVLIGTDGRLWDGHHRVAVALALGIDVPVMWAER